MQSKESWRMNLPKDSALKMKRDVRKNKSSKRLLNNKKDKGL